METEAGVVNSPTVFGPLMQAPLRRHTLQPWPRAQEDTESHQVRSILQSLLLLPLQVL